jgi:hypothetical protein
MIISLTWEGKYMHFISVFDVNWWLSQVLLFMSDQ